MNTIDFRKELRPLYTAGKRIAEVDAGRGVFLAVDGQGTPGGEVFQQAVALLFNLGHTLKFQLKGEGVLDFKLGMLEALWLDAEMPADWNLCRWRVLLRVPEAVTAQHLRAARKTLLAKKALDAHRVRRVSWREGKALQVLHVGPYDACGPTYEALQQSAAEQHYRVRGPYHEIYLNDPRRVGPERTRTIIRMPISHPRPAHARAKSA